MRNHDHSVFRLIIDTFLVILLILLLISPVFLVLSLKIKNLNLQAKITESVAGTKTSK